MKISDEQLSAAYDMAKLVFEDSVSVSDAADRLQSRDGMNIVSARDLIRNFRMMIQGRVFERSMSAAATEIYLSRIREDYGEEGFARAIASVEQHIAYYETLRPVTLRKLRAVVSAFKRQSGEVVDLVEHEAAFRRAVEHSMRESEEARARRLAAAPRTPRKVLVSTRAYIRNPDVVAAVLVAARGSCGNCGRSAPFKRDSDGTPYLEVHHKKQLSDGGEDTVENAIALCPNCHRWSHLGNLSYGR